MASFYVTANLFFPFAGSLASFYVTANLFFPFAGSLASFYVPANLFFLFAGSLASFYVTANLLFLLREHWPTLSFVFPENRTVQEWRATTPTTSIYFTNKLRVVSMHITIRVTLAEAETGQCTLAVYKMYRLEVKALPA
ncbi:hypothetical protein QA612_07450 [Evansella sp. AB-P1]|uniref:hypothetical protein n=1 Tax=Evansella sp. AB-P1 TaxID=3037653 RepID=UPI00241C092D|nr:hypothetical protein [Evansella sp. AB-P1]MDG5787326.1 hypothetical protein [Evansella sp. AB-P1]